MAEKAPKSNYLSPLIEAVIKAAETDRQARVITFAPQSDNPDRLLDAGGQCSCCGAGPRITAQHDWWLIFQAGLADSDGVFYSMLCAGSDDEGCLGSIRAANAKRKPTFRDEAAQLIAEINGDDVDGMQSDFEDFEFLGMLDPEDE